MEDKSKFWRVTVDRGSVEEKFVVQGPDCYDAERVTKILMEIHEKDWRSIKKLEPIDRPEWANAFLGD